MKRLIAFILCFVLLVPISAYSVSAKSSYTISLKNDTFTYDGKVKKPAVTVKYGDKKLKNGTDYTVTYPSGCKYVGKYTVTVRMEGRYSGKKSASFIILPPGTTLKTVKGADKSLTVSWLKKTAQTSGYKIQYSTNKNFSKAKYVTIDGNSSTKCTIDSLKSGTKYYVRIRTYKVVADKVYYSAWSSSLSASTNKASSGESTPTGVYITPTGKCYHYNKNCAGENAKETTYAFASANYRPCSRCVK